MLRYLSVIFMVLLLSEACRTGLSKTEKEDMKKSRAATLPIPYPKYMKIEDPAHVTVRWDPVTVSDDNPILGFKIKLWEDQKQKVHKFVERDGEQVLIEELVSVKKPFDVLPTHDPAFEAVVPPDKFSAEFDVKKGEHYEVRGQSYSVDGDGPLSNTYGFRIGGEVE